MTRDEILAAVKSKTSLYGADLQSANLQSANLQSADLRGANLQGADLQGADLQSANLYGADLYGANLQGANLQSANLRDANLQSANLRDANLQGADLRDANLQGANLCDADLRGADLRGADLRGANLQGANLRIAQTRILPEGDLIGWKKCQGDVLVKLRIPQDAKRSHAMGRKCRAEYVDVIEIIGADSAKSNHDNATEYRVGDRVTADSFDDDWTNECSHGIHFFITRIEAEHY